MECKLIHFLTFFAERYTEIERENRILLEKMSNIMQKKPSMSTNNIAQQFGKRSKNGDQRRKDLVKITIENQHILKRLQKTHATYSVERWEGEFAAQCKIRDAVCENPYQFGDGLQLNRKRAERERLMTA